MEPDVEPDVEPEGHEVEPDELAPEAVTRLPVMRTKTSKTSGSVSASSSQQPSSLIFLMAQAMYREGLRSQLIWSSDVVNTQEGACDKHMHMHM